eukprot:TRINITY_DN55037_c0_g1_i1.p1 TRINITY_DN55037_c0_g1~~TRINITY_DN55037_c0_g1_i1.p1  ORF type:complete len:453 (+),score=157.77 TRINITY_DN55037_c0_g1_i1:72-1361(+)
MRGTAGRAAARRLGRAAPLLRPQQRGAATGDTPATDPAPAPAAGPAPAPAEGDDAPPAAPTAASPERQHRSSALVRKSSGVPMATKGPPMTPVPYTGDPALVSDTPGYLLSGRLGTTGTTGSWKGGADLEREAILKSREDGTTDIVSKPADPVAPSAHFEGSILDFSDRQPHPMQKNPFGELAEQARQGQWGGVSPDAIAIPGQQSRSVYGFERRGLRSELINSSGMQGGILPPQDLDPGVQLSGAKHRLPGFDPIRESLFDKYIGRTYKEKRDLRRLESESVWARHNNAQFANELNLRASREGRQVVIKDAVMQSPYKWLHFKYIAERAEDWRQSEDTRSQTYIELVFYVVCITMGVTYFAMRCIDGGTLRIWGGHSRGCPSCIEGTAMMSECRGSWNEVGGMYKFQDKVARHMARLEGAHVNAIVET